jgi:hypothetical protein
MAVIDYSGQIAAINAAIASGATSVSYEGKSVTYRDFNDMIKTVAYLQRLQDAANGTPARTVGRAKFNRGYRGFRRYAGGWSES